jgi:hypothetical protein
MQLGKPKKQETSLKYPDIIIIFDCFRCPNEQLGSMYLCITCILLLNLWVRERQGLEVVTAGTSRDRVVLWILCLVNCAVIKVDVY